MKSKLESSSTQSGFAVLLHSRAGQALCHFWSFSNNLARPLLPLLHLAMLIAIGVILFAVVFANQHTPCWYDEICMLDPAYHRAATGIWHSIAQWDSIDTIPFAPNYPLLINILRFLIACFGIKFWILRGAMLLFGLLPVAVFLWLFRRCGIFQSRHEVLYAAYFMACFSFFWWAIWIRPEAVLLSVAVLLVFAWATNRPVLLFCSALLVPLCGLQWNVLLVPVMLHWLFFGGRIRNPFIVASAFVISSITTIATYHALGMWPSYLQEAARIGDLDTLHNVINALRDIYLLDFNKWIGHPHRIPPPVALGAGMFLFGGCLCRFLKDGHSPRSHKCWLFVTCSSFAIWITFGLLANVAHYYMRLIIGFMCLCYPIVFGKLWQKRPVLLFLMALLPIVPSTLVLWHTIRDASYAYSNSTGVVRPNSWLDEASLEKALRGALPPNGIVCCDSSAYFAVRACGNEVLPLCYAFDLSEEQIHNCSAILLEDNPVLLFDRDYSDWRKTSYTKAMQDRFCPADFGGDTWSTRVSSDDLVSTIAAHWHCTFTEIPLALPEHPNTIRFRLFRPVFSADSAS